MTQEHFQCSTTFFPMMILVTTAPFMAPMATMIALAATMTTSTTMTGIDYSLVLGATPA